MRSVVPLRWVVILAFLLTIVAESQLAGGPGSDSVAQAGAPGEPGPTAEGRPVDVDQLPEGDTPQADQVLPRQYPDAAAFGREKARANASAAAAGHIPGGGQTAPGARFPTLDRNQAANGGFVYNPPDGGLAVGPDRVLVAVNEAYALYDTSGQMTNGPVQFNTFFNASAPFDPRAIYDAGNTLYGGGGGRFVVLTVTQTSKGRNKTSTFNLAVSRDSTATAWCTYTLNAVIGSGTSATWADFPGLGMDGDNLYLTSNQFTFSGSTFQFARILVVPKVNAYPSPTGTICPTLTGTTDFQNIKDPDGTSAFTVQPVHQPDAVPGLQSSTMYFVDSVWPSGTKLGVRSITSTKSSTPNTPTGVSLNNASWVNVGAYNIPADAPQPGSSSVIDTGDARLLAAVQRYGKIYTANTTQTVVGSNDNPSANAQSYVFTPGSSSATTSAVADPSVAFYYPSVHPGCASGLGSDSNGVATCSTPFVGIEVTGSSSSQAASAFFLRDGCAPTIFQEGVGGYSLSSRWGDYSAISSDPSSHGNVWVYGQYAKSSSTWGTAVDTVTASSPSCAAGSASTPTTTSTPTNTPTPTQTSQTVENTPTPTATATATPAATATRTSTATPTATGGTTPTLWVGLTTSCNPCSVSQTVTITATVQENSSTGAPVSGAAVVFQITSPAGQTGSSSATTGTDGKAVFSFAPRNTGTYNVTATASKSGYSSGSRSTSFLVQ